MKKKIIVLVGLFILLVIWNAPVSLVDGFIPKNKGIVISGMNGSIWSGTIDDVGFKGVMLREVNYQISPFALLTGTLGGRGEISSGDATGDFSFSVASEKELAVENANLSADANIVQGFLPMKSVAINGQFITQKLSAEIKNTKLVAIDGVTEWRNANVVFNGQKIKIGNIKISWSNHPDKKQSVGTVINTANAMALDGRITLSQSGSFEFKGSISTKTDKAIYNAMLFFSDGKESNGRLPIKFRR
jgi:type II secretion system (T2SS) protein N